MAKNFTCMWGLEGVPTFLDKGKGKGQDVVDQDRAGPGCFAVGLDRITTQQGVDGDGGGCHRSCQRYWTPQTRSLVKLPEVLGIRNMSRARAISDLLVVALCRTSSTSSPAERERSTAHDIGECTTWDT